MSLVRNGGFVCGIEVKRISASRWGTRIALPKRGVRRADLKGKTCFHPGIEDKFFNVFAGEVSIQRADVFRAERLVGPQREKAGRFCIFTLDADPNMVVQPRSALDVFQDALFWSCGASRKLDSDYMVDYKRILSRD